MNKIKDFFMSYINILILDIKEHLENVPQVFKLSIADLKKTYTGAALGWAWAVIKPIVTIFVYWFAIAIGLRQGGDIEGVPYILWLICGIISWFYMGDSITGGTDCIRRYSYLITKMKYPVTTIPTHNNLSRLYNRCLSSFQGFCSYNYNGNSCNYFLDRRLSTYHLPFTTSSLYDTYVPFL